MTFGVLCPTFKTYEIFAFVFRRAFSHAADLLLHTTALRGNRGELNVPKPFLKPGAFRWQQIQTVSRVKLERRLGALTVEELALGEGGSGQSVGNLTSKTNFQRDGVARGESRSSLE